MHYRGLELDHFQRQAIEAIQRDRSVIVSAPTGTGKTLIADYLIEQILEEGGEVIYTSPIKALSNQKYRQYAKYFGEDKVGLVTGDLVIRRDAPLRIMTTEILRNILLEGRHDANLVNDDEDDDHGARSPAHSDLPDLRKLRAVIIDEIHFLDDPDRGTVWEELLIYLPHDIRILGLSATLSNLEEFTAWLNQVRQTNFEIIYEPKRNVPLKFFMMNNETGLQPVDRFNKSYAKWRGANPPRQRRGRGHGRGGRNNRKRGGKREQSTRHIHVIESLHPHSYPALYFIFSRALVERLATELARTRTGKALATKELKSKIDKLLERFDRDHPTVLPDKLRMMYRRGIAFHHAGLHVALKNLVEELYEAGLIRVLYCTSTFALGINMPARTVIFDALTKYNGTEIAPLTVREFMQMAGRAGRRGIDVEGDIIIRQDFEDYEEVQSLLKRLFAGESEPVTSSFNLAFHAVVNLLDRFDEEDIRALLGESFKAWRSRAIAEDLRERIDAKESLLSQGKAASTQDRPSDRLKRHRRQLTTLKRQLVEEERPRLWEDFHRKVEFLRTHGYLAPDNTLLTPALILKKIKMEEIFLTELVMQGVLEDLSPEELYGVMCGLVQTMPRSARVRQAEEKWDHIVARVVDVYRTDIVQGAAHLTQNEVVMTPEIMHLGERWALGEPLHDLMDEIDCPTDLSGDLVGALRRAKDLISQLRSVYDGDEYRRRELTDLMRKVTRDEVEAVF